MEDCRKWVRSKLQERDCKPSEFVRTVPCYDPSQAGVEGASAGMSLFPLQCLHCKPEIKICLACSLISDIDEVFGLISSPSYLIIPLLILCVVSMHVCCRCLL